MINDDNASEPSQSGNPSHQSSSGNPIQFTPEVIQALVAALAPALQQVNTTSPVSVMEDPHLTTNPTVPILEPYEKLEKYLPTFAHRQDVHAHPKWDEDDGYTDIKHFPRVRGVEYTAPVLPSNLNTSKHLQKRDQELATLQTKLANLTRPIDATVHAILSSTAADPEDPITSNILETMDILRYNLAALSTEIGQIRTQAICRDKNVIPPTDPNGKTPIFTHQDFIDQQKFTKALKKATGQGDRSSYRGRNRGSNRNYGYGNQGNRSNEGNTSNTDTTGQRNNHPVSESYQYPSSDSSRQSFHQASTPRGRGRGRGRQ
ncbi:hypothetical protein BGW38_009373 [Lunasporangiospora selenospora]|uniref:Uncharacterized protein n=1 Tax=Lunasporangiospora selenospora TaxID=979761 RepID=A0A9P6KFC3_9FUNG|nr:hypothetical protein BGW38_009373 [Lunasporangiospora selenospora]